MRERAKPIVRCHITLRSIQSVTNKKPDRSVYDQASELTGDKAFECYSALAGTDGMVSGCTIPFSIRSIAMVLLHTPCDAK
jgi:hypothetical protein